MAGYMEIKKNMNVLEAMQKLGQNMRVRRSGEAAYLALDAENDEIVKCNLSCRELTIWQPDLYDMTADDWEAF